MVQLQDHGSSVFVAPDTRTEIISAVKPLHASCDVHDRLCSASVRYTGVTLTLTWPLC